LVIGIGTDMIEVDRIKKFIARGESMLDGVYTHGEIEYCASKRFPEQHFAARFAAKEAFMKALGTGWRNGIRFADVEVVLDDLGKPGIMLDGKGREILEKEVALPYHIHLSMAHLKQYATATVIIETRE
jgi:holo-[acyl-carrier protein] synthase